MNVDYEANYLCSSCKARVKRGTEVYMADPKPRCPACHQPLRNGIKRLGRNE